MSDTLQILIPALGVFLLGFGGGIFAFIRWIHAQEEKRREDKKIELERIEIAKRETEETVWMRAKETIENLRKEVEELRCEVNLLREENKALREEVHVLTKMLEDAAI